MAEVEQRRRQEEEARLQKLKEQDEEKRRLEEQQARRREQEERERALKLAEQRRQEEERRAEQERERQREIARKQAQEEEARRQEEVERREREERFVSALSLFDVCAMPRVKILFARVILAIDLIVPVVFLGRGENGLSASDRKCSGNKSVNARSEKSWRNKKNS